MKKIIASFISLMMLFTMTGCAQQENPNDALVEKYKTIIDALEQEDYTTAAQEVSALASAANEAKLADAETIELTPENFNEYFEIKVIPIYYKNGFGELETLRPSIFVILKDEYRERYVKQPANERGEFGAVEICASFNGYYVHDLDTQTGSYTLTDLFETTDKGNIDMGLSNPAHNKFQILDNEELDYAVSACEYVESLNMKLSGIKAEDFWGYHHINSGSIELKEINENTAIVIYDIAEYEVVRVTGNIVLLPEETEVSE